MMDKISNGRITYVISNKSLEQRISCLGNAEIKMHLVTLDKTISLVLVFEALEGCQISPHKPMNEEITSVCFLTKKEEDVNDSWHE
jgi:hypothetical protein